MICGREALYSLEGLFKMVTKLDQTLIQVELVAEVVGFFLGDGFAGLNLMEDLFVFFVDLLQLLVEQTGVQLVLLPNFFVGGRQVIFVVGSCFVNLLRWLEHFFKVDAVLFELNFLLIRFLCLVLRIALEKALFVGETALHFLVWLVCSGHHPIVLSVLSFLAEVVGIQVLLVGIMKASVPVPLLEQLHSLGLLFVVHQLVKAPINS